MVFLGTPAAAVPCLRALNQRADIALVVTRGDRRRGRSAGKTPSEVKKSAMEMGLATACPESRVQLEQALRSVAPFRMGLVVAYGMLLTRPMLDLAEMGFVNVHFSLLPRWRGAAPVAAAIRAGDPVTGVSLMKVTEGLDSGPVVAAASVAIGETDERGGLTDDLSGLGADLLAENLGDLMAGRISGSPQREEDATYAPRLTVEDGRLDFERPVEELARQVRAMAPRPGAFARWKQARMRILRVRWSSSPPLSLRRGELALASGDLWCGGRDGGLILDGIQPPGKRVMAGSAWANGVRGELGSLSSG
ncbi:MAG: methionyl-tRNA formyltransferase [Acidimicrobiia bacterium]|nr:methionyl-tRNA formyltransferase [Acidimicrobiia bacterium]